MIGVKVTITGDKETVKNLKKMGQELYRLRNAMRSIGKDLTFYYANNVFASQGGAIGERWPRLSGGYALRKAKRYPGRGPLIKTGNLKASFDFQASDSQVVIGNTASYFKYHQSSAPRTKIPYRPMMKVDSHSKSVIKQYIQIEVTKKIREAGL